MRNDCVYEFLENGLESKKLCKKTEIASKNRGLLIKKYKKSEERDKK